MSYTEALLSSQFYDRGLHTAASPWGFYVMVVYGKRRRPHFVSGVGFRIPLT